VGLPASYAVSSVAAYVYGKRMIESLKKLNANDVNATLIPQEAKESFVANLNEITSEKDKNQLLFATTLASVAIQTPGVLRSFRSNYHPIMNKIRARLKKPCK
jgi:hypothetical protein